MRICAHIYIYTARLPGPISFSYIATMGDENTVEVSAWDKDKDKLDSIDGDIATAAALAESSSLKGSSLQQQQQQQQQSRKTNAAQGSKGDETGREYYCGIRSCHPSWLQWLRDARVFTFLLCLFSTVEGALINGTLYYYYQPYEPPTHVSSVQWHHMKCYRLHASDWLLLIILNSYKLCIFYCT